MNHMDLLTLDVLSIGPPRHLETLIKHIKAHVIPPLGIYKRQRQESPRSRLSSTIESHIPRERIRFDGFLPFYRMECFQPTLMFRQKFLWSGEFIPRKRKYAPRRSASSTLFCNIARRGRNRSTRRISLFVPLSFSDIRRSALPPRT